MSNIRDVYRPSLATLTDLYELTMAAGYVETGIADREAVFNLTFRARPFHGGYAVAAGLADAIEVLDTLRFAPEDLAHLASLRTADGSALFQPAFLDRLETFRFACDVDAIPEGTVVFPHEPLVRIRGPLLHAQLAETMLLTIIGFQTLVATKAARIVDAADGDPVLEFGLRRAQGVDGGLSVSRAAWIGGVAATSNVLAGQLYGIPVRGTHAHSWVQAFGDEQVAFDAYAEVASDQYRAPGRHVRHVDRGVARHRDRATTPRARPRPGRDPPGFRRSRLPVHRGATDARRRRLRVDPDRRVQRPRRGHDQQPEGPGCPHRHVGRGHASGDLLRPAGPRRGLQADRHPRRGRRHGGIR